MKLNKISIYAAAVLSVMGASSCSDYLGKEVDLTLQADLVFSNYDMTRGFQAQTYVYLPDAFEGYNDTQYRASNDCMTDNAVDYWGVARYHAINADSYDATNHWFAEHYWNNRTTGIRHCNQYMKNAQPAVVGNAEKSGDDNKLFDRWFAEVAVIRALLHFDLVTWFGDAPIIGDDADGVPIILEPAIELPARTPADEVLLWVAQECDKWKDKLPFRYSNEDANWGRINGAAAYALKARALLYRASPLYNKSNDKSRWSEAAAAAEAFITKNASSSNPYRLYTTADNDPKANYYNCFVSDPVYNNEYILSRSVWTTLALVTTNTPPSFYGASGNSVGYVNPTQNLVDAYETINGLPIDKDPTYDPQKPYVNRDPRLDQTIFHQGTMWGIDEEQHMVNVNFDENYQGEDFARGNGGTATGYFSKKYVHNIKWDGSMGNARVACPIFRYAEILLNAAEAFNEADNTTKAMDYVNEVRKRVGMPKYQGMSKEQLRERIRNERRVELCFEDHRYFDMRRWKLFEENGSASAETSKPRYQQVYNLYSVSVTGFNPDDPNAPVTYTYGPSRVDPKVAFRAPKNYFFPIMHAEMIKTGYAQTPGWE